MIADDYDLYLCEPRFCPVSTLYCLESQWDDAFAFYHDGSNYRLTVQTELYGDDEALPLNIDFDSFDALAAFCWKIQQNDLHWVDTYAGKDGTFELPAHDEAFGKYFFVQAKSVDKRLNSIIGKLFLYDERLYCFIGMDAGYDGKTGIDGEDMYYFLPLDDDLGLRFIAAIKSALASGPCGDASDF